MENIFVNTDKELKELFDSLILIFLDERAISSREWLTENLKKDIDFHTKNAKEAYTLVKRYRFEEYF